MKNIAKRVGKEGVPAAIGGTLAAAVHSAVEKFAGSMIPAGWEWTTPLIPGLVGVAAYSSNKDSMRHGASAMIGYSVGTAVKPQIDSALGDDVLADDLDDIVNDNDDGVSDQGEDVTN